MTDAVNTQVETTSPELVVDGDVVMSGDVVMRDAVVTEGAVDEFDGIAEEAPAQEVQYREVAAKSLEVVLETKGDVQPLLDMGFGEEFLNSNIERFVAFDAVTGLPVLDPEFCGKWKSIKVEQPITGMTRIVSDDKSVVITMLHCETRTQFLVIKGEFVFIFVVDGKAVTAEDGVLQFLTSNLVKGPRVYTKSAEIMNNFWAELMKSVYKESVIVRITLHSAAGDNVPSKIYFDPNATEALTLSVGGWCYNYNLNVFPKEAINKGTKLYSNELAREKSRGKGEEASTKRPPKALKARPIPAAIVKQMKSEEPVVRLDEAFRRAAELRRKKKAEKEEAAEKARMAELLEKDLQGNDAQDEIVPTDESVQEELIVQTPVEANDDGFAFAGN